MATKHDEIGRGRRRPRRPRPGGTSKNASPDRAPGRRKVVLARAKDLESDEGIDAFLAALGVEVEDPPDRDRG